jgi:putative cell wall-binding protein
MWVAAIIAICALAVVTVLVAVPSLPAHADTYTSPMPAPSRIAGADRFATSVAVAKKLYPSTASIAFIATGENYPDALAAAPAATKLGGPLLLTAPDALPSEVSTEISSLHPSTVVIVGGVDAVSPAVQDQLTALLPSATVTRISGADRYATADAIDQYAFHTASSVYMATGQNFPDALSAAAAAGAKGEPIVLVDGSASSLDAATTSFLTSFGVHTVIVSGGGDAVSIPINLQLQNMGINEGAAGGLDRYQTSDAVNATAFGAIGSAAYIATGTDFPDALSAATLAAGTDSPLFLSPPTCFPEDAYDSIQVFSPSAVTLVGGTSALGRNVADYDQCATNPLDVTANVNLTTVDTNSEYSSTCEPGALLNWSFSPLASTLHVFETAEEWTYRTSGPNVIEYACNGPI